MNIWSESEGNGLRVHSCNHNRVTSLHGDNGVIIHEKTVVNGGSK